MTSVPITITTAGLAKLVNASATGSAAITIAAIGVSASVITPTAAMTSLAGEIKRLTTISGTVVAPATIHIGMLDATTGAYTMNSFALYLADGTLFALYGQSTPIYVKTASSDGLLACDITFTEGSAAAITFGATGFLNPPASATVMGVVQLATQAQANAGTDGSDVLTPATAKAALLSWLGYTPVEQGGGEDQGTNKIYIGWSGTALRLQVDTVDEGTFVLDSQVASQAGAGIIKIATGPEAIAGENVTDAITPAAMLAAFSQWIATALAAVAPTSGSNANGYWRETSDGFIEQWGTLSPSNGTFDFPIPFQVACTLVQGNNTDHQGTNVDNAYGYVVNADSFFAGTKSSTGALSSYPVAWYAKGR